MQITIEKKRKISELIVDELITQISKGQLKTGEKLPTERALAESLGVSRMPLREAIHALGQAGILETRHGEGTYVCDFNSEKLGRSIYWFSLLNKTTLFELVETRKALEAEAAKLACRNASKEEIKDIYHAMVEREEILKIKTIDDDMLKHRFDADRRFHEAIAKASHNSIIANFLMAIHASLKQQQKAAALVHNIPQDTSIIHREIYEAILIRDEVKAQMFMDRHLTKVLEAVKSSL